MSPHNELVVAFFLLTTNAAVPAAAAQVLSVTAKYRDNEKCTLKFEDIKLPVRQSASTSLRII
ncbi:hypothetical protein NX786_14130 [Telluria mixta]|uniref:Uncharacterized protein n=1 Tax=Telluria mixta TaxID=34071 RepID=A0ABT2BZA5_9BURK|nr:hypothetical protein [Telluria mixta]MCS0630474.1 hypothetical protein [Telluria mixta]WEM94222.1 hypothetical protein P0M04_22365 [Telluria mixta]